MNTTKNSREGSRKRKYVDIEFSKYTDKEKDNLNDLLSNQRNDLVFEKQKQFGDELDTSYVAHVQFVESPEKDRSHTKNDRSRSKNNRSRSKNDRSRSRNNKPQYSNKNAIKLFPADPIEDDENKPVKSHLQQNNTKENIHPNENRPFKAREAPVVTREPFLPTTSATNKGRNLEKWKEFFHSLNLKSSPKLRPILVGRLFMIEKIEQCYHHATSEWMTKKNQKIRCCKSIENLYQILYSRSKAVYNQNLMN